MSRASPRIRRALLAVGFCFALVGTLSLLQCGVEAADIESATLPSDIGLTLQSGMSRDASAGVDYQILMLGDSMILPTGNMTYLDSIPFQLNAKLQKRAGRNTSLKIYRSASPGAGYQLFYFSLDKLIETDADLVLYEFQPTTLSPLWRATWARTDNVSQIGFRNIPEAVTLPLDRIGVTLDRMLWTVTCVELGCGKLWRGVQRAQLKVSKLYAHWLSELAASSGMESIKALRGVRADWRKRSHTREGVPNRRSEQSYRELFGQSLTGVGRDDPALVVIGATVRRLVAAGIPTIVYVIPVNVEAMQQLDIWNQSGFDETVRSLATVVEEAGGRLVDLHNLLRDKQFRDAADHMTYGEKGSGQDILSDHLVPPVVREMRRARRRAR